MVEATIIKNNIEILQGRHFDVGALVKIRRVFFSSIFKNSHFIFTFSLRDQYFGDILEWLKVGAEG